MVVAIQIKKMMRWQLGPSATGHYELPKLELLWAWEPTDRRQAGCNGAQQRSQVGVLMETKVDKVVLERIGRKIQFSNLFVVPRHNIGGGLALYWPADMKVDVQTFLASHIDVIIDLGVNDTWRFTGFYGDPETANRESSWSLLRLLSHQFNLPWVCMGDFNEILFAEEKQGWLIRLERRMQGFRDALDFCRLRDLGFNGFPFTWCNRRPGGQNVWIRLDRGVASVEWILRFLTARIHHLDDFHSDHKPLLLCSDFEFKRFYRKGRPFCFEAMWLKYNSCEGVIWESWESRQPSNSV